MRLISKLLPVVLIVLLLPTVYTMFKVGIFSMHDFHVFRLYEYDKCAADLQIPCRWSPDSGLGYGEPVFNFYTQVPYIIGELFRHVGFSILDSIKILFGLSLLLSGLGMFFLAKQIWHSDCAAFLSAIIYTYAPYRAVDIYVRGALPEALAFILFPVITLAFNDYITRNTRRSLYVFIGFFTLLILTHNLSALMYSIFLLGWGGYQLCTKKQLHLVSHFLLSGLLILGLTSFYILPVIFEGRLVSLDQTVTGYYDYNLHFVTLKQLFLNNFWGYGASNWGENDGLSLAVGYLQWVLPLFCLAVIIVLRKVSQYKEFIILLMIGFLFLFLTHNKSVPIWHWLPPLRYIQFPWRFLGMAVFSLSLASGVILKVMNRYSVVILVVLVFTAIVLNKGFYKEDRWFMVNDVEFFSGSNYITQVSSALTDFWPKTAKGYPKSIAPSSPSVLEGSASGVLLSSGSYYKSYQVAVSSDQAKIQLPIVYFPGWQVQSDNKQLPTFFSGDLGLVTVNVAKGQHRLYAALTDTPVRLLGNTISAVSLIILLFLSSGRFLTKHQ